MCHRDLSYVYAELISHTYGNEVYVRTCPQFAGLTVRSLMEAFAHAVLIGIVRWPAPGQYHPLLNPSDEVVLMAEDRLVFLARDYEHTTPRPDFQADATEHHQTVTRQPLPVPSRRVLLLGWSHKVHALLQEFSNYAGERLQIDLLSVVPSRERETSLARYSFAPDQVQVRQLDGDYTLAADLLQLDLMAYDNIVCLGSDWLESGQESDARTVLGYVLLRALLPRDRSTPEILVELMDPDNARLFQKRPGEVIISPLILSHMLAHVSLRRELCVVFDALFGSGGSDILFRPVADYDLIGQAVTMRDVQRCAACYGEIALGVRRHSDLHGPPGGVYLHPPMEQQWSFSATDEVVVLA